MAEGTADRGLGAPDAEALEVELGEEEDEVAGAEGKASLRKRCQGVVPAARSPRVGDGFVDYDDEEEVGLDGKGFDNKGSDE